MPSKNLIAWFVNRMNNGHFIIVPIGVSLSVAVFLEGELWLGVFCIIRFPRCSSRTNSFCIGSITNRVCSLWSSLLSTTYHIPIVRQWPDLFSFVQNRKTGRAVWWPDPLLNLSYVKKSFFNQFIQVISIGFWPTLSHRARFCWSLILPGEKIGKHFLDDSLSHAKLPVL